MRKVDDKDINLSKLSLKVLGKQATHFYGIKGGTIPQYDNMTKMLEGDLATVLGLNATELDEFIELWKNAQEKMYEKTNNTTHRLTDAQKNQLDELVDRIKSGDMQEVQEAEEIQETEPKAEEAQEAETTFAEFIRQKVEESGLSKSQLSKDLDIYEDGVYKFTKVGNSRLPSQEIMMTMLSKGLATKLDLANDELDTLVALWKNELNAPQRLKFQILTEREEAALDELVASIKSGTAQETEPQVEEAQAAEEIQRDRAASC